MAKSSSHSERCRRRFTSEMLRVLVGAFPAPTAVDWDRVDLDFLIELAEYHRVGCLLMSVFTADVPGSLRTYILEAEVRRRVISARIKADQELIAKEFARFRRPWLILKGPALSELAYQGGSRDYRDLDLLVDGCELSAAIENLVALGGKLIDVNFELMESIGSGELTVTLPSGTVVDLHWHPINSRRVRRAFRMNVRNMVDRSVVYTNHPLQLRTFDATDTLLYCCVHACLAGGDRLLWLKDIQQIITQLNWSSTELIQRTADTGTALLVGVMLARARSVLGVPVPDGLVSCLNGNTAWSRLTALQTAFAPPQRRSQPRASRMSFRSTRATSWTSLRELSATTIGDVVFRSRTDEAHPWRKWDWDGGNPLKFDVDFGARERYLRAVCEAAGG